MASTSIASCTRRTLSTCPLASPIGRQETLIFAGRPWLVREIVVPHSRQASALQRRREHRRMPERAVPAVFVSRNLNKREHPSGGPCFRKHQHQGRGIRRFFQQKGPQAGTENLLAGAGGFEPPHGGIKIHCLTTWRRPNSRERADTACPCAGLVRLQIVAPLFNSSRTIFQKARGDIPMPRPINCFLTPFWPVAKSLPKPARSRPRWLRRPGFRGMKS